MEILNLKEVNKGALVCFFGIKLPKWGNFIINDCAYMSKDGKRWISFPQKKVEVNGETKYYPYNKFEERDMQDKFMEQVMKLVEMKLSVKDDKKSSYEQREIPF